MSRRWVGLVVAVALVAGGCSDDDDSGGEPAETASHDLTFAIVDGASDEQVEQLTQAVEGRLDALGIEDATVTVDGDELYVDVEGDDVDLDEISDVIGASTELRFRPVLLQMPREAVTSGEVTVTPPEDDAPEDMVVLAGRSGDEGIFQLGPSQATGEVIDDAEAQLDPGSGQWSIALTMTPDGIEQFNELAAQCAPPSDTCPTGQLAMVLDSEVLSAPTLQTPSFERDEIQISGSFTEQEAKVLAAALRTSSVPAALTLVP